MAHFYYRVLGQEFGPISLESLQNKIASGELGVSDGFRLGNGMDWASIADFSFHPLRQHSASTVTASRILNWDGGHDDFEPLDDHGATRSSEHRDHSEFQFMNQQSSFVESPSSAFNEALLAKDNLPLGGSVHWMHAELKEEIFAEIPHGPHDDAIPSRPLNDAFAEEELRSSAPGSHLTHPDTVMVESRSQWYARMGQVDRGPMAFEKLLVLAATGYILPTDRVREGDNSAWKMARSVAGLFETPSSSTRDTLSAAADRTSRPAFVSSSMLAPVQPNTRSPAPFPSPPPVASKPWQSRPNSPEASGSEVPTKTIARSPQPAKAIQPFVDSQSRNPAPVSVPRSATISVPVRHASEPSSGPAQRLDIENKHKLRRGHYHEPQLLGRGNWKMLALLGLVTLLLFLIYRPKPATLLDLGIPYHELTSYYNGLNYKWAEKPTMELWMATKKDYVYRLESLILKIKKISLRHAAHKNLISAAESMIEAAKSETSDEVTTQLSKARTLLDLVSQDLVRKANSPKTPVAN